MKHCEKMVSTKIGGLNNSIKVPFNPMMLKSHLDPLLGILKGSCHLAELVAPFNFYVSSYKKFFLIYWHDTFSSSFILTCPVSIT